MTLVKIAYPLRKQGCASCGDTGPFYWAVDNNPRYVRRYVLIHYTSETRAALYGDIVSNDALHVCAGGAK